MQNVDGSPGLNESMIDVLRSKVASAPETYRNACLMIDAMAVRKQVCYDSRTQKMTGLVDLGDGQTGSDCAEASEALVFMVVGLTGHWKAPVAYFFTKTLQATTQTKLVEHTLDALAEVGVRIWAITMDGHATNFGMCRELGCSFNMDNIKPSFKHPRTNEDVFIIMDPCHMLKLARNLLHALGEIVSPAGSIRWAYIRDLHNVQDDVGLRMANKITAKHVNFNNQKMKVSLAAQVLSNSVALALKALEDGDHPKFRGAAATVEFIQVHTCKTLLNLRDSFDTC